MPYVHSHLGEGLYKPLPLALLEERRGETREERRGEGDEGRGDEGREDEGRGMRGEGFWVK